MNDFNMKKAVVTFPITTGKKKRLITTYRDCDLGQELKQKHQEDLKLLEKNYPINKQIAYAYLKDQSIKHLVDKHLDNSYFYQFDLKNFFASINHTILLDKLTATSSEWNQQLIGEASNRKPCGLALGLVPSPYLSNIYLSNFDADLNSFLNNLNPSIVYTRYSDDLTISSPVALDLDRLTTIISDYLQALELELNISKTKHTHLAVKGQHLKILGLNIIRGASTNYVTVGRKFKSAAHYEKDFIRQQAMTAYINYNED